MIRWVILYFKSADLVHDSGQEEPDLHEHEVGCRVEVGQVDEGEVVVEAVEQGGDHVVRQDVPVLAHL